MSGFGKLILVMVLSGVIGGITGFVVGVVFGSDPLDPLLGLFTGPACAIVALVWFVARDWWRATSFRPHPPQRGFEVDPTSDMDEGNRG